MSQYANLIDKRLLIDASALNAAGAAATPGVRGIVAYIIGSSGVASGAVQLEHAHDKDYTGTWAAIGAPVTVVADTVSAVVAEGAFKAVRARVSTVLAGGTVTVLLVGN